MARINQASLRAQLHDCRAQFDAIQQKGEASADTLALINALFMLVDIVVAVFLERTTPKTSRNSGLPSSRDGTDDGQTHTEGKSGSRSRGPKARHARSDNLRTVTTTHTSAVTGCRQCGHDLTGTACTAHEQRVEIDIVFETVERQVTAEIKTCPRCHTRTKGTFPATMPGPVSARSMSEAICGDSARTRRCAKVGAPRRACKPRRGACLVKRTHFLGDGRQCRTGFFCTPSFPTPVCGRFSSRSTKPRRNDAARRAVRIAARRCTARPTRASRTVWRLSSERMPGGAACVVATVGVG